MKAATLTSNAYYGGFNSKWDRRAELLEKHGFRYTTIPIPLPSAIPASAGFFVRKKNGRVQAIPAVLLRHANKRDWLEQLRSVLGVW